MSFGIDHPLIAVNDLEHAAACAGKLGFTLNPRHSHPWGTDNHLLFLGNNFIELIGIARPEQTDYADANGFRFAKLIEARLAVGEGIAMVALESESMERDHATVMTRGFQGAAPIVFRRLAHLPDGRDEEVGVALDILHHPEHPYLTQFLCQQLRPELFRADPQLEQHANTATSITDAWYVSDDPRRDIDHFRHIHGDAAIVPADGGFTIHTDKGDCHLLTPHALSTHFPGLGMPFAHPPRAVALTLACEDLDSATGHWRAQGIGFRRPVANRADVGPEVLGGTLLSFVERR